MGKDRLAYAGRGDYDVLSNTWRTVATYHRLPPCAVGTLSAFRLAAIARSDSPRARCAHACNPQMRPSKPAGPWPQNDPTDDRFVNANIPCSGTPN